MSDKSDLFDEVLSGAIETATRAARAPGADTARRRGNLLRTRRRLAASAMSLVLLGAAGGVAASALHKANAVDPNPNSVVASAWLSGAQLPFGSGYADTWIMDTATFFSKDMRLLSDSVYKVQPGTELCNHQSMASGLDPLAKGADGEQYRSFYSPLNFVVTGQATAGNAEQQILFFPTAAMAQTAWNTLPSDFATCKQQLTVASPIDNRQFGWVEQTANQSDAECWSTLATATSTQSAAGGTLTHFCFVWAGQLITEIDVDVSQIGSFSLVDFGRIDSNTVSALRKALGTAYGLA